jgi:hypothetical protein
LAARSKLGALSRTFGVEARMQTAFAITDEYSRAFEQRDALDVRSKDDTLDDDRDTPRAISNEEVFGREWVEGVE